MPSTTRKSIAYPLQKTQYKNQLLKLHLKVCTKSRDNKKFGCDITSAEHLKYLSLELHTPLTKAINTAVQESQPIKKNR